MFCICSYAIKIKATVYTGLRPICVMFFKFLLISFQMKNNDDIWLCYKLSKSLIAEEKTNLSPSVCTCMAIKYG